MLNIWTWNVSCCKDVLSIATATHIQTDDRPFTMAVELRPVGRARSEEGKEGGTAHTIFMSRIWIQFSNYSQESYGGVSGGRDGICFM